MHSKSRRQELTGKDNHLAGSRVEYSEPYKFQVVPHEADSITNHVRRRVLSLA